MNLSQIAPGRAAALASLAIPRWSSRLLAVFTRSMSSWVDHRAGSKGAALAFYTLFSITPILILAIAGAGYFFGAEAAQGEIIAQVEALVGRNGAQAIQALLAGARDPSAGLAATVIASVFLLVGATSVFVELKGSLDEMWGIDRKDVAVIAFLRTQLHSFGLVLVLAFLLLVSLVLSAGLAVLERYADGLWSSSYEILGVLSSVIAFATGCAPVLARCLDRRGLHGGIVQPGQIRDRPLSRPQRGSLEFRRRRIRHCSPAMGVLLGANLLSGRGVYPAVRARVRQPAATSLKRPC